MTISGRDKFSYFSLELYNVTPHLVQMRGQNICFYEELTKNIQTIPSFSNLFNLSGLFSHFLIYLRLSGLFSHFLVYLTFLDYSVIF